MNTSGKRRAMVRTNVVAAGSVWDTRIKMDEFEGGVKFFNSRNLRIKDDRSQSVATAERRKRRIWTPQEPSAIADCIRTQNFANARKSSSDQEYEDVELEDKEIDVQEIHPPIPNLQNYIADISKELDIAKSDSNISKEPGMGKPDSNIVKNQNYVTDISKKLEIVKPGSNIVKNQNYIADIRKEKEISKLDSKTVKNQNYVTDISKEPEIAKPDSNIVKNQSYVTDISKALEIVKPDMNTGKNQNYVTDINIVKNQNYDTYVNQESEIAKSDSLKNKKYVTDINKETKIVKSDSIKEQMVESTSSISDMQTRMCNIVNLIMWRDIPRSAFVFGFGNIILVAISYAKDLNFSLIQTLSCLCFAYLAMIFLYKSILGRGSSEFDERDKKGMIGEEEAICALRFLLPYINEALHKIRALYSGNPASTIKLALLLFVFVRCGGSISTYTLSKLVFCGVFTIPKLFSCYHIQLVEYCGFWLERFQDEWESCSHKRAVAVAVFTVVWIVSSPVSRVWAVFILVVAIKLHQQRAVEEQWNGHGDDFIIEEDYRDKNEAPTEDRWGPQKQQYVVAHGEG